MRKPIQTRSIRTRERLLQVAADMAARDGLGGLRTDVIVAEAGVAKGTFFAHFPDKDHLIAVLVARRLVYPQGSADTVGFLAALRPMYQAMVAEPEVLDCLARFAGPAGQAAGLDQAIFSHIAAMAADLGGLQARGLIRPAPDPGTLAEGVFAFLTHAAATAQCHVTTPDRTIRQQNAAELLDRLVLAWLMP